MPTTRTLPHLPRKLQTWELQHLRQLVAAQQAQIEAQSADIAQLQRELSCAEDSAERWRDDALQAIEDAGCAPGLTITGQLIAVQAGHA
jgi:hypothetical protein